MFKSSRERLIEITDFALNELRDLQTYYNLDYNKYEKDKDTRRLVERIIENITNAVIDILKISISEKKLEMPDSYADIMEKGGSLFKLNENQLKHLIQIAKLRNILAHEYLDLKWDRIKNFLSEYQITVKTVLEQTSTLVAEDIKNDRSPEK
jgi:uncharacterized protein YutE (UPF0331/DUF86 family)